MDTALTTTWTPTPDDIASAQVTALMRRLGVSDYDALHRLSVEDSPRYWREVLAFCDIVWSRDYSRMVDVSAGPEFPKWFVGGELNWVDTVLAHGDDPRTAGQRAVVGERENGDVMTLTYAQLKDAVHAFSSGLRARGIVRGDRIGLLMENGVEATVTLLAVAACGAIIVPLFSGFGTDAIVSRLGSCEARLLIASTGFRRRNAWVAMRATVLDAMKQLPSIAQIVWKRTPGTPADVVTEGADWSELAATVPDGRGTERMSPDDPFMVIYTSGTTGKPKGTVHIHGGFPFRIAHDAAFHFDLERGDVLCWPADMGWIAGSLILGSALLRGATLVCYDGAPDWPDWSRMSRLIERHRVTHFGSAPTLIRGMVHHEDVSTAGDVSTVKLLITAGESIAPDAFMWYQRAFGRGTCPVINYTGGTEVSGSLLSSVVVRPIAPSVFNSATLGIDADVVDAEGHTVFDRIGELAVRAPFVGMTQSFWQDRERYLDTYWRAVPGVWIHGDLAMRTADGSFMLLGRSDDTIKLAGKRLGPAEVEEVLLELPMVGEAAAIGVFDADKGQKLVVFVIPKPGWTGDQAEAIRTLKAHVDARLGRPFRPSSVLFVKQFPKTRSAKVMRRLIRATYCGDPPGDLSALDNPSALDDIRAVAGH